MTNCHQCNFWLPSSAPGARADPAFMLPSLPQPLLQDFGKPGSLAAELGIPFCAMDASARYTAGQVRIACMSLPCCSVSRAARQALKPVCNQAPAWLHHGLHISACTWAGEYQPTHAHPLLLNCKVAGIPPCCRTAAPRAWAAPRSCRRWRATCRSCASCCEYCGCCGMHAGSAVSAGTGVGNAQELRLML